MTFLFSAMTGSKEILGRKLENGYCMGNSKVVRLLRGKINSMNEHRPWTFFSLLSKCLTD